MNMYDKQFWFVVGSQFLYGPEVLEIVAARAAEMADKLNASGNLPCKLLRHHHLVPHLLSLQDVDQRLC